LGPRVHGAGRPFRAIVGPSPHRLSGRPARRTGIRVASRLPFLPRTVALASRRTHPPEVTRACRGSGSSGSAVFGSALPRSRFRRLPGVPTRSADRVFRRDHASPGLARPFRARRKVDAGVTSPASPSWASLPYSASGIAGSVTAGFACPPPSVLGVSHARDGLHPAIPLRACFIPVTLLGFHLQGFGPRRGPCFSRSRCSLAVGTLPRAATETSASELCSPRKVRTVLARKPGRPLPSWCFPSKAPCFRGGAGSRCALARTRSSLSILPCTSPLRAGASESRPAEASASPLAGRRPFWGSPPRLLRSLAGSPEFR